MSDDDDKRALCAVWEWTHQYGAALKPPGADTYGEGMRDAKKQVKRLLSGAYLTAPAEQAMRNLVAVIDRDGGHAQPVESVTAYKDGVVDGAAQERARIVAFVRKRHRGTGLADLIERGEAGE